MCMSQLILLLWRFERNVRLIVEQHVILLKGSIETFWANLLLARRVGDSARSVPHWFALLSHDFIHGWQTRLCDHLKNLSCSFDSFFASILRFLALFVTETGEAWRFGAIWTLKVWRRICVRLLLLKAHSWICNRFGGQNARDRRNNSLNLQIVKWALLLHRNQFFLQINAFHGASQAKIAHLYRTVVVYQNISRFQISVDNICCVQIFERTQDIIHDRLDLGFFEMFTRFEQLFQIHVTPSQNQIYFFKVDIFKGRVFTYLNEVLVFRGNLQFVWGKNTQKSIAARVRDTLQNSDFAKKSPGTLSIYKNVFETLAGIFTLSCSVHNLHHLSISSFP